MIRRNSTPTRRSIVSTSLAGLAVLAAFALCTALPAAAAGVGALEFLGRSVVEVEPGPGMELVEPLGGLSGLTYDPARSSRGDGPSRYYSISDDASVHAPARFYTLEVQLTDGKLEEGGVRAVESTVLKDLNGEPFPRYAIDGEGIALAVDGTLFISSEGHVNTGVGPFLRRFSLAGESLEALPLPDYYQPESGTMGIRHNLGFEALTMEPAGLNLWSGIENALVQDGPEAVPGGASASRILRFDLGVGSGGTGAAPGSRLGGEYVYWNDPVVEDSEAPDAIEVNGLVELTALGSGELLALERSYSSGGINHIRLYEVDVQGADRVSGPQVDAALAQPVRKELLLDLTALGIPLDNLEGMTFGPSLPDGRRLLLLVSDDNFSDQQVTHVLAFAVTLGEVKVAQVQGAGHRSPMEGQWLHRVRGVVTAVEPPPRRSSSEDGEPREPDVTFWIQSLDPDDDPATSEGLRIVAAPGVLPQSAMPQGALPDAGSAEAAVRAGDVVEISGRVAEIAYPGELPITTLEASVIHRPSRDNPPPQPVVLGEGGRMPPSRIFDADALEEYRPTEDGLDFFESLEGMRVMVREPVVVGPTTYRGGFVVVGDDGRHAEPRTHRGGLSLLPEDFNPERILVDTNLVDEVPDLAVGDRLLGPVIGVVAYRFGEWRVWATEPLPPVDDVVVDDASVDDGESVDEPPAAEPAREVTTLRGDDSHLTVATFNVLNLDPQDPSKQFEGLARTIAQELGAPDVVALQEIQDDDGPVDNGLVTARRTLKLLIDSIFEAGGPVYDFRQIDPENNADGGQPGGNIRVAYLFNPQRVRFVDRGDAGPRDATAIQATDDGPRLTLSPGRVAPLAPSFDGDEEKGWEGGRRSLAAEMLFTPGTGREERFFLINNHWKSKRGDDRLGGSRQPPVPGTEVQRAAQAQVISDFVEELLAADPQAAVIVLGDLNEHEFRSPLAVLAESGLVNLVPQIEQEDRYTYNYLGNSQVLDHILVSPRLAAQDPQVDIIHANADYPDSEAASDHDPIVARVRVVGE
ncbi:MAG: esterase-like activity of phytase family protein [Acidobacteriota bacterium]|nr:esterase-like activity of phytase family protein [Acidobacteriota bacterium]